MSVMHFPKFRPRGNYVVIANRWKAEAVDERKQTAREKEEFRTARVPYRSETIEMRSAITASHHALIADAGAVLEAAMKENGFTGRFRISIRGDR